MKKIIAICVCFLLVAMLATTVMAAGSASFSASASSKQLRRGETITLTVSVSCSEPATSYGLQLSYDSAVFELVNGSTNASGALVNSFNNGFAAMFQTPTAYTGSIGTVTLRVKDNAAFGNYTISGSASVKNGSDAVAASGCSVSVSVVCDHNYGAWSEADSNNHAKTCSVCNDVKKEAHTWDKGTVLKQANCKEGGQVKYTCTTCSATKTENTEKTTDHKYGNWTKVSDTQHKHTCSVCSKEETVNHSWNNGTVTKKATCKEAGEKKFTCTGCSVTKTEEIPILTTHTYDHACDTDCNVCGLTRTTTHKYSTKWSANKENHWHECSVCKDKKDETKHTPGAAPTETKAQTCTTCGYVIKAALGHKHNYAQQWTTDDAGHWYACSGCAEKGSYAEHDFENACDQDCSICGYTRQTEHVYDEAWANDDTNHWHVCSGCGLKQDEAAHEPGAEATETTAQTCTICGYEIAPALGVPETEPTAAPTEPTQADAAADSEGIPVWIFIAVGVVIVGVVAVVIIKKKS